MHNATPSFGDHVRIRSTTLTEKLGLAGQEGTVHGETTPSVTNVDVIGATPHDFAVCVTIGEHREQLWFAPELVEVLDHAPGTEFQLGGRTFVRDARGEWAEAPGDKPPLSRRFVTWLLRSFHRRR